MDGETGVYRIGAVAHLTGLSAHTLRAWERRYANLHPVRTDTGLRLYSESQVERLRLIQRLIGEGYAIGTLAALALVALFQTKLALTGSEVLGGATLAAIDWTLLLLLPLGFALLATVATRLTVLRTLGLKL